MGRLEREEQIEGRKGLCKPPTLESLASPLNSLHICDTRVRRKIILNNVDFNMCSFSTLSTCSLDIFLYLCCLPRVILFFRSYLLLLAGGIKLKLRLSDLMWINLLCNKLYNKL
jgi:hypothetical protein